MPAPLLGPSLLLASACAIGLVAAHGDALRRVLLRAVDPRPLALMRIGFGVCLLLNLLEVWPLADYLFSDEGLLPRAAVVQIRDSAALAGYGDGVRAPVGFHDAAALLHYVVSGRWSVLHFVDSPLAVRIYLAALTLATLGMLVGARTRVSALVAWVLYVGLLRRGDAHWGGEQVLCGFLVLLAASRCGAALSVDNWLRCRRLRARGLLSEPEGPGQGAGLRPGPAHPQGLAAIYPRIPAWPQALIAVQLALLYVANGWAKSGAAWAAGDGLTAALLYDPYVRWDMHGVLTAVGPWPFRLASWAVLWWERLFPLALVGLWLQASARAGARPPAGRARVAARACWLGLAVALLLAAWVPEGMLERPGLQGHVERAAALAGCAGVALALALGRPSAATLRRLAAGPLAPRVLGFGLIFHLMNFALLNVGAFALATVTAYSVYVREDAVAALQWIGRRLARRGLRVPAHLRGERPIAAEDPALPQLHRDGAALPGWALAGAGGLVLAGATLAATIAGSRPAWWWHAAWLSAGT